jgi:hypothetical protein
MTTKGRPWKFSWFASASLVVVLATGIVSYRACIRRKRPSQAPREKAARLLSSVLHGRDCVPHVSMVLPKTDPIYGQVLRLLL